MSKATFSSRLTASLSVIGVAVGLGNVWRFPYMMGKYGGSAFLFIYILFVMVFAIPALGGELSLGRQTGRGPIKAFSEATGSVFGKVIAYMISTAILVANAYYIVVIANLVYLTYFSGFIGFGNTFHDLQHELNNGILQFGLSFCVLACVILVVIQGLKKGVERFSKYIVPVFAIVMIYLLYRVIRIDGAIDQLILFLKPDFEQLTIKNIFAALGQAFFSLSLGGTILVVYGSFLKKEENILKISIYSGLGDMGASLLVSLILVPTILLYGLNLQEGHTLLFSSLPVLFEKMPEGRILGTFFLFSVVLMAFLSSVAAVQFLSTSLNNNTKLSYKKSVILIGFLDLLLIIICSFHGDIIPILDMIFGSGMQVLGSCCAIIVLTWFIGKKITIKQIFKKEKKVFQNWYFLWLKWIIPVALILTLVLYIHDTFKNI